ncbi:GumC family protein [Methylocystis heyeri]|uniref:non-specific protein-tyrosine kinase n=1 Tax=Methylocystis heyeri TaxID=391905 RepID=A0A6B8KB74_9HYPH|nr:polysaccharide biosynthesis tyrosine autokinase [Methylocystis heyeri]QGM44241.1 polysaccharide biosynthesis tyrosine autokinase [Methylocystis heyeri]QGM47323.1 polysaccharide biosynthesis tyrosine autokinase [Methylocystis heyeri]
MHGKIPSKLTRAIEGGAEDDAIDLRQVQDFLHRRWKLILACAACVMVLAFLITLTIAPRYTAMAQVLLEPRKEKIFGGDNILPELNLETGNVDSQLSVIQSTNLLRRVVEKEKLTQDPEFGPSAHTGLLGFLAGLLRSDEADKSGSGAGSGIPPEVLNSIKKLKDALEVARVNRTYVLSISVTSEDPAKAARLANAVADAYVVDQLDARYDAAKRASVWLAERMEGLQDQLRQSEEAVSRFRKEHNLQGTGGENKVTISEQQLSELNGKLISARADAAEKRAKYEQAAQVTSRGGNVQAIPDVVHSSVISELRRQQAEVARKEADLLAHYGDQHPLLINARAERRDIDRSIAEEIKRILINLKNDYDVAKSREASLQNSLDQVTGLTGQDNGVAVRLRELERINASNKTLFENFMSRAKITQEQSSFEEREARVISPATKPISPSFPKKGVVEALAGLVGLLLGTGGAIALDMLNSGFSSSREVEDKLGYPVLGAIPLLAEKDRRIDGKVADPGQYLLAKPLSRYAEVVRAIRVGIQMADVDHPAKAILITSSIPSEGKSTLALSLALSAGKAGQRVLLIDGDLRHPSTSKYFGLEDKPGLVDFLTAGTPFEQIASQQLGVTVIPAGMKSQNPPDLLGSERMKRFVEKLRDVYDYIVIDSPPVEPVIDAKVLTPIVDKVVFVVRWQTTKRETAAHNTDYFASGHKLAGVALTVVDESQTPKYGAYGHYSGYYYKKYYHN